MTNPVSEERLRNTRAWAAARVGSLSGADVIVGAIDELLERRRVDALMYPGETQPAHEPAGDRECALQDLAYRDGAQQALAMAHQSLKAADEWFAGGCGNRVAPARAVLNRQSQPPADDGNAPSPRRNDSINPSCTCPNCAWCGVGEHRSEPGDDGSIWKCAKCHEWMLARYTSCAHCGAVNRPAEPT